MQRLEFVRKLAARDSRAWRDFVKEFGGLIWSVSARFRFSDVEREEHFQLVCLKCLRAVGGLHNPERIASWVFNVAKSQAIDMLRRRRRFASLDDLDESLTPELHSEAGVEDELERLQTRALIEDAISKLDSRCIDLLQALFLEDPNPGYREIGRRLALPIGSIGPMRARCLEKLEKNLSSLSRDITVSSTEREAGSAHLGLDKDKEGS